MKKVKFVHISNRSDSDENAIDFEIARDCVKRANVVFGQHKRNFRQDAHNSQARTSRGLQVARKPPFAKKKKKKKKKKKVAALRPRSAQRLLRSLAPTALHASE